MKTRLAPLLLSLAASVHAEERRVPFWPDSVVQAIQDQVDGVATLETVRELGRFHRVHGSPGFAKAADHVRNKAAAAGSRPPSSAYPPTGRRATRTSEATSAGTLRRPRSRS
jgi:hypothetical protein